METYRFEPQPPMRAGMIGSILDVAGAVLIVLGITHSNTPLAVIGVIVFLLGPALITAALVAGRKLRTIVVLDDDGIEIRSGGQTARCGWGEISSVTRDGGTIYLLRGQNSPVFKIDSPRGAADPQLQRLAEVLTERLDRIRGYHSL